MIRKANLEDASRIAEILIFAKRAAYRSIFQDDKVAFMEMQVLPLALQYIENPDLLDTITVFDDGIVKGMANTKLCTPADGAAALEIVQIYVDPFFQHNGVGEKMLREIEGQCRRNGVGSMYLWVLAKNQQAIYFYEKHGFQPAREQQLEEGTTELLVKYAKKI